MLKTRKMVFIAILGALSFVLMLLNFPLLPGADFLKLDFSILPMLIGLVLFDLKSAYGVLVLRTLLKLLLDNGGAGTMIGLPMNVIALALFLAAFALLWKKTPTRKNFILASVAGTVLLTLAMLVLNLVYAVPMYAQFANFDIGKFIGLGNYLWGMVLPFNLIEGAVFALVFGIVYLPCRPILEKYTI
ncbi:ECF transporter S component [Streptococcus caprae]|uniref:Riboflavin transporter n=1 Tax=Streptococcus caprae TaxID=1640501 RepID=A0ABV8CT75_9STRE